MSGESTAVDRDRSFLLAALTDDEYKQISGRVEPVDLPVRDDVYRPGEVIAYVYFPLTAVFSILAELDGEASLEVATIGREGMVGLPVFLGVPTTPHRAVPQIPGTALRMSAEDLRASVINGGGLHRQIQRYVQAMIVQLSQNVACNQLHTTEERAARWLLMTADRVDSATFPLTQEFLAQMLGVRRGTVSLTAGLLQSAGLISYRRGVITIEDRDGLVDAACDCYRILKAEFDALRQAG
jgi:CRP-like cAMP-binding protein